jgi:CheY-like chemotaxis protein
MEGGAVSRHACRAAMTTPGQRTPGAPVRVLAVDDGDRFRDVAADLVAHTPGFEFAGESCDGASAVRLARELDPDLVLLDVRMAGMDGIETARRLLADPSPPAIVLISLEPLPDAGGTADLPIAAFLRKQELSVRRLEAVWAEHRQEAGAHRGA